jgi:hypothetical protein
MVAAHDEKNSHSIAFPNINPRGALTGYPYSSLEQRSVCASMNYEAHEGYTSHRPSFLPLHRRHRLHKKVLAHVPRLRFRVIYTFRQPIQI